MDTRDNRNALRIVYDLITHGEPLARLISGHERRVDERNASPSPVVVSAQLAACPTPRVQPASRIWPSPSTTATPVSLATKVAIAFAPGKVNADEASICHPDVIPRPLLGATEGSGDRMRRLSTVLGGA